MHASVLDLLNSHDYTVGLSTFQGARFKHLPVHSATLLRLLSAPGRDLRGLIALGTSATSTAASNRPGDPHRAQRDLASWLGTPAKTLCSAASEPSTPAIKSSIGVLSP